VKTRHVLYGIIITVVMGLTAYPIWAQVLYSDDFNADTSANYTVKQVADSATQDSIAIFSYDYSADSIPAAPSGTGTKGLKMMANYSDSTPERAAINVYPTGQSFSGEYSLTFDMWIGYSDPALSGSTQSAMWGINCSGTKANADPAILQATDTDGYFWSITGEGGSIRDSISYEGTPASAATSLAPPDNGYINDADGHEEEPYPTIFPAIPPGGAGWAGKQWVKVKMTYASGNYKVYLNDTLVYDRTDSTYTSGDIMLGYEDIYTSISAAPLECFAIYDNLVVAAPTPIPTVSPTPPGFAGASSDWQLYK
jgi:hypothetical protein